MFSYEQYQRVNSHPWQEEVTIHYMMRVNYDQFMRMLVPENTPLNLIKEMDTRELFLEHKNWGPAICRQDQSDKCLLQLISQPIDFEELNESPLAIQAIKILGFVPTYEIKQKDKSTCILESIIICTDIKAMLENHRVSYFITIEDKGETSFIASGYNPRKELRINNQREDIFLIDKNKAP